MKRYDLSSIYGKNKNGYYGKAVVIEDENGNLYLQSYSTVVCGIINGEFKKFWDGYSTTTVQHINDFVKQNGMKSGISKKEWENMPVESCPIHPVNSSYKVSYY